MRVPKVGSLGDCNISPSLLNYIEKSPGSMNNRIDDGTKAQICWNKYRIAELFAEQ
jgi:hypothetical protein